jgi:hypothetical protein
MRQFAQRLRQAAPRPLTEEQILVWADAFYDRTGQWPKAYLGSILDAPGETWLAVNHCLFRGARGLPGGSSLAKLFAEHRGVRNMQELPPLSQEMILQWADTHHKRTGTWPTKDSGAIVDAPGERWVAIDIALRQGHRELSDGSSLARLLANQRQVRNRKGLSPLTIEQILSWADAYQACTGKWPKQTTGSVEGAPGETWSGIHVALAAGIRGLPGGSSLPRLLAKHRGARNKKNLPPLSVEEILKWADDHYQRTGQWPKQKSGSIVGSPGETWLAIDHCLNRGSRGLSGGSSLAQLLAEHRGVQNPKNLPRLTLVQILAWADAFFERKGQWPRVKSGSIAEAPEETWEKVNGALVQGVRGLPGGSSLAQVLAEKRGVRNIQDLSRLTIDQILAWADAHHARTGQWPRQTSGDVEDAPGEKWANIQQALVKGFRGLPGGSSLVCLIKENRGKLES